MDADIAALLQARGAADIAHPGGTLLAHLGRVASVLDGWGAPASVVGAGAAHALYGTDGFATALAGLDERPAMAALLGPEVEALIYLYGSADRRATYPTVGTDAPKHHDRFTGVVTALDPLQHSAFVEITYANELDVLGHSDHADGTALRGLFTRWAPWASAAAYSAARYAGG